MILSSVYAELQHLNFKLMSTLTLNKARGNYFPPRCFIFKVKYYRQIICSERMKETTNFLDFFFSFPGNTFCFMATLDFFFNVKVSVAKFRVNER